MSMDQVPDRQSRVDGDSLLALIGASVAGVVTYTASSSLVVAAGAAVLAGVLASAGLALRNRRRHR
jgi:hypothetical protein